MCVLVCQDILVPCVRLVGFYLMIHTLVEMPCKNNRVYKYDRPQHSATHLV